MFDTKIYHLITRAIPNKISRQKVLLSNLYPGWDAPDTRPFTKKLGDKFLYGKLRLLPEVPSVMMPEEINYVINPVHHDFQKVKIVHKRRIFFDKRIDVQS